MSHSVRKQTNYHLKKQNKKTYFVSFNMPCAPREKWHRKEHIVVSIIITVIIISLSYKNFLVAVVVDVKNTGFQMTQKADPIGIS